MTTPKHVLTRQVLIATANDQRELLIAELQRAGVSLDGAAPVTTALAVARKVALDVPMIERALVVFEDEVRPTLEAYLWELPHDRVPRVDCPISSRLIEHFDRRDKPVTAHSGSMLSRMVQWLRRALRLG
jgi:hypothetical protein